MGSSRNRTVYKISGRKILLRITVGLVLVFAVASAVAIYFEQENQMKRIRQNQTILESQLADTQALQAELQELHHMIDTDEYIERIARELGMVKPNEVVFDD